MELIRILGEDMGAALVFLPWGLAAGGVYLAANGIKGRWDGRAARGRLKLLRWAAVVYLAAMLWLAFFSREPGSRTGMDLELFGTWGTSLQSHAYFIENMIMFLPFGLIMPEAAWILRKAGRCAAAGFLVSTVLELMQLAFQRGYCQLDDVMTNTMGTVLGWMIWRCWNQRKK